jgi:hypothetical protein
MIAATIKYWSLAHVAAFIAAGLCLLVLLHLVELDVESRDGTSRRGARSWKLPQNRNQGSEPPTLGRSYFLGVVFRCVRRLGVAGGWVSSSGRPPA